MNIFPRVASARPIVLGVAALICASLVQAETTPKTTGSAAHAPKSWTDIDGRSYQGAEIDRSKATVFVFASTLCPISNIYMPRVTELARTYGDRGVRFYLVDPNSEDTTAALRAYAKERKLPFPVVIDTGLALADWLGASRTPEVVVVKQDGDLFYRGRIDDNQDRSQVVHSDLKEAIDAALAGTSIAHPRTLSFGCAIFRDTVKPVASRTAKVTFTRDIAPLLNKNCVVCHRSGESAPFALQTFRQARTWATAIKDYTARRIMPPWKAAPGAGDFHDARTLTQSEIDKLGQWVDSGAPEGSAKDLPAPPRFPDPKEWTLGRPDVVTQPSRPYHLAAEGPDVYRNFVLPVDFDHDRYVSAMEFKPGNRAVVHHVVLYIDENAASLKLDGKDTEPGYTVPGTGIGILNAQWGEVWVPGRTPRLLPSGVAVKIAKGSKLVMQVHYHKNGAPQSDSTQVAVYFAKSHIDQAMHTVPLVNPSIALKPGVGDQKLKMSFTLPLDAHLHTIFPHMHLIGRQMRATAILPDGEKKQIPLINVTDWDFNWQETYAYREPVALPKGTRVEVEAIYDNTDSNPRQANHPAKTVYWGEQTTDEMCVMVLGLTVDREKLNVNIDPKTGGI